MPSVKGPNRHDRGRELLNPDRHPGENLAPLRGARAFGETYRWSSRSCDHRLPSINPPGWAMWRWLDTSRPPTRAITLRAGNPGVRHISVGVGIVAGHGPHGSAGRAQPWAGGRKPVGLQERKPAGRICGEAINGEMVQVGGQAAPVAPRCGTSAGVLAGVLIRGEWSRAV